MPIVIERGGISAEAGRNSAESSRVTWTEVYLSISSKSLIMALLINERDAARYRTSTEFRD